MTKNDKYPKQSSSVEVTFIDGEIKNYSIDAGIGIARYLAINAGETGMLTLLNGSEAVSIPVAQIREYRIQTIPDACQDVSEAVTPCQRDVGNMLETEQGFPPDDVVSQ